jgi:mono/diheme cytochrome c family protein
MKLVLLLLCLCLCSCRRGMVDQAHTKPLTADPLNAAESSARPIPSHTVARGHLDEDESFFTGMTNGLLVTAIPVPINHDLLARGRERFDIYCAVCHGPTGDGNGMIVQRGFPRPPSFHDPRLRDAPVGHFFDVIKNGYGVMYSYASRVTPDDRWAIIAYIRALQLSQHAPLAQLPPQEQAKLEVLKSR